MNLPNRLRKLATELDALGTEVDERWKVAERRALASTSPRTDEQETQKLGGLSALLWEAYRQLLKRGIPAADKLAALEKK